MSEVNLWRSVKKELDGHQIYGERLTDKLHTGIPDSFFIQKGITHWMELKVIEWCTGTIEFQKGQIEELYRRHRAGAPTWVLIREQKAKRVYVFGGINIDGTKAPTIPFGAWKGLLEAAFLFHAIENQHPFLKRFDSVTAAINFTLRQQELHSFN